MASPKSETFFMDEFDRSFAIAWTYKFVVFFSFTVANTANINIISIYITIFNVIVNISIYAIYIVNISIYNIIYNIIVYIIFNVFNFHAKSLLIKIRRKYSQKY
ncbi:hypothetical protein EHP00_1679 [Ecytonucleospora hepatopenaei]|uniref:Uncharacterized protein n=1 Tax=Ecytonucleospora hepatopenaei TaxID=646526 RepID=A0A1W0E8C9_9MICR|nr:hypothetical protein EHP00_1679 [Ecytonucleospora hepatopenaei]